MRTELQCLLDEIAGSAVLALHRAVAIEDGVPGIVAAEDPDSFDATARALLTMVKGERRSALGRKVAGDVQSAGNERVRVYGRTAANVNLAVPLSITRQVENVSAAARFSMGPRPSLARNANARAAQRFLQALNELNGGERLETPVIDPLPEDIPPEFTAAPHILVDASAFSDLARRPQQMVSVASGILPAGGLQLGVEADALETKYIQSGGESGPLGRKLGRPSFERDYADRLYRILPCENGVIIYSEGPGANCIWGRIYEAWQELGGPDTEFLGVPIRDQRETPRNNGAYTGMFAVFEGGGAIYDSPAFGAHEVHGAIRVLWGELGFEQGAFGFPKTNEMPSIEPAPIGPYGARSEFRNGAIMWSIRHGAVELIDQWDSVYRQMEREIGNLGYPVHRYGTPQNPRIYCEGGRIARDTAGVVRAEPLYTALVSRNLIFREDSTGEIDGRDEIAAVVIHIDSLTRRTVVRNDDVFPRGLANTPEFWHLFPIELNDEPHPWPRTWTTMIVLSEVDGGDSDEFAQSILDAVQGGLEKGIEAAATAIGVALTGPLGPAIGALIGEALKLASDALFDELNSGFSGTMMFPPVINSYKYHSLANWVPSIGPFEGGWTILTENDISTSAGGGTYRVRQHWLRG